MSEEELTVDEQLILMRIQLATIEHTRWAEWQRYMHSLCQEQPDGSLLIPASRVLHWSRQIALNYDAMTVHEQSMDMEQVDRYWPELEPYLRFALTVMKLARQV